MLFQWGFIVVANVEDIDLGWNRIKKELKLLNNSYTKVGIQGKEAKQEHPIKKGKGKNKKGATIAEIGLYNEYGTPNAKHPIPTRPFMRSSFEENKKQIDKAKASQYGKILDGKQTVKRALGLIGELMVGKVKKKITDLRTPPNADWTINAKGSSNPLIDTGRMRASITHVEVLQGKEKEIK